MGRAPPRERSPRSARGGNRTGISPGVALRRSLRRPRSEPWCIETLEGGGLPRARVTKWGRLTRARSCRPASAHATPSSGPCLGSYTFPAHEKRVGALAEEMGFRHVSLSSEVMPMVKAVPRGFTTAADAYLTPIIARYVKSFRSGFDEVGSRDGHRGMDSGMDVPSQTSFGRPCMHGRRGSVRQ